MRLPRYRRTTSTGVASLLIQLLVIKDFPVNVRIRIMYYYYYEI